MDIETIKDNIDTERIYTELQTFVVNEDQFQDQMEDPHLSVQICLQGINAEMDPYFGSRTLKHIADDGFKEVLSRISDNNPRSNLHKKLSRGRRKVGFD